MKYRIIAIILISVFGLTACGSDIDEDYSGTPVNRFKPLFDPSNGVIPFPSNLLFSGSVDGTLNIPVADAADLSDPKVAMNGLDGFSTLAPIKVVFSQAIDSASLPGNVRLFRVNVTGPSRAVTSIAAELSVPTDFVMSVASTDSSGSTLVLLPMAPLTPKTTYMVVIETGVTALDGQSVIADRTYLATRIRNPLHTGGVSNFAAFTDAQAQALEPLRQLINYQDDALDAYGGTAAGDTVLAWTFTTQSINDVLIQARTLAGSDTDIVSSAPGLIGTTGSLLGGGADLANVYAGTLTVPYYLAAAASTMDPTPLQTYWKGAGGIHLTAMVPGTTDLPVKTANQTLPILISTPKTAKPVGGWPTVIFQHGITSNRTSMLAIADSMAAAGYAVVAIDLPLHGLTSGTLKIGPERTFDLDLVTQDGNGNIVAAAPDGVIDSSGRHFINLSSLLTSRDNLRQAAADLFALRDELGNIDYDTGGGDFDTANVRFVGHSLGGIVGVPFLAQETGVQAAVLGMPGGGVAKLLDGSATFGPQIAAGLAATGGLSRGTADYESFFGAAQTVIDSADPMNFATTANAGHNIMMFEIVGNGGANLADQVVPNHVGTLAMGFTDAPAGVVPSPIAGSFPLRVQLGLTLATGATICSGPIGASEASIRFTAGDHRSLLDPTSNSVVTTVMQTATAGYLSTNGAGYDVSAVTNCASVVE